MTSEKNKKGKTGKPAGQNDNPIICFYDMKLAVIEKGNKIQNKIMNDTLSGSKRTNISVLELKEGMSIKAENTVNKEHEKGE